MRIARLRSTHIRSGLIPLSVCAALMLAACGGDDSVSSPTDPTLQPPVAVNVVGSGGDTAEAASTEIAAQDASASSANSDRSIGLMPAFGGYVFEVGEDLPALPANSTGYHFPAGASVDVADVSRIAAALGSTESRNPLPRQRLSMAGRTGGRHRTGTVRGRRRPVELVLLERLGDGGRRGVRCRRERRRRRVVMSARVPSTRLSTQPPVSPSTNRCRPATRRVTSRRATSLLTSRSRSTSARPRATRGCADR